MNTIRPRSCWRPLDNVCTSMMESAGYWRTSMDISPGESFNPADFFIAVPLLCVNTGRPERMGQYRRKTGDRNPGDLVYDYKVRVSTVS